MSSKEPGTGSPRPTETASSKVPLTLKEEILNKLNIKTTFAGKGKPLRFTLPPETPKKEPTTSSTTPPVGSCKAMPVPSQFVIPTFKTPASLTANRPPKEFPWLPKIMSTCRTKLDPSLLLKKYGIFPSRKSPPDVKSKLAELTNTPVNFKKIGWTEATPNRTLKGVPKNRVTSLKKLQEHLMKRREEPFKVGKVKLPVKSLRGTRVVEVFFGTNTSFSMLFNSLCSKGVVTPNTSEAGEAATLTPDSVRRLVLIGNPITSFVGISKFYRLVEILITNCVIKEIKWADFEPIDATILQLNAYSCGLERIERLQFTRLRILWISGNKITSLASLAPGLASLEKLNVGNNQIEHIDEAHIYNCVSLIELNLAGNPIWTTQALHGLKVLGSLEILYLADQMYGKCPVIRLPECQAMILGMLPDLKSINGVAVTENDVQANQAYVFRRSLFFIANNAKTSAKQVFKRRATMKTANSRLSQVGCRIMQLNDLIASCKDVQNFDDTVRVNAAEKKLKECLFRMNNRIENLNRFARASARRVSAILEMSLWEEETENWLKWLEFQGLGNIQTSLLHSVHGPSKRETVVFMYQLLTSLSCTDVWLNLGIAKMESLFVVRSHSMDEGVQRTYSENFEAQKLPPFILPPQQPIKKKVFTPVQKAAVPTTSFDSHPNTSMSPTPTTRFANNREQRFPIRLPYPDTRPPPPRKPKSSINNADISPYYTIPKRTFNPRHIKTYTTPGLVHPPPLHQFPDSVPGLPEKAQTVYMFLICRHHEANTPLEYLHKIMSEQAVNYKDIRVTNCLWLAQNQKKIEKMSVLIVVKVLSEVLMLAPCKNNECKKHEWNCARFRLRKPHSIAPAYIATVSFTRVQYYAWKKITENDLDEIEPFKTTLNSIRSCEIVVLKAAPAPAEYDSEDSESSDISSYLSENGNGLHADLSTTFLQSSVSCHEPRQPLPELSPSRLTHLFLHRGLMNNLTNFLGKEIAQTLTSLNLSANHIHIMIDLSGFESLKYLNLSHNHLTSLQGLVRLPQLLHLNLQWNAFKYFLPNIRPLAVCVSQLLSLDLLPNPFGDLRDISHMPRLLRNALPRLTKIDVWTEPFPLQFNLIPVYPPPVCDSGFVHTATTKSWGGTINCINELSGQCLTGLQYLLPDHPPAPECQAIDLNLSDNYLRTQALENSPFVHSEAWRNCLTRLQLQENMISNLDWIQGFVFPSLQILNLSNNFVKNLEALPGGCPSLRHFYICGNLLPKNTDSIAPLRFIEHLTTLDCTGSPVSTHPEYSSFVAKFLTKVEILDGSAITEWNLANAVRRANGNLTEDWLNRRGCEGVRRCD